jgi:hypothetical protein
LRANLRVTSKKKGIRRIKVEPIRVHMTLVGGAEMEYSFGIMEKPSKESGGKGKRTDMEYGDLRKAITIRDNGNKICKAGKGVIITKDARCTADTSRIH